MESRCAGLSKKNGVKQQMKRIFADRHPWPRILARRFYRTQLETADFTGAVTLLCLDAVREPLWKPFQGEPVCIVDAGFSWLHQFPAGAAYTVTTMFDRQGQVVQWYIDICAQHGLDSRGIPWFDDLYVDVIVAPDRALEMRDVDELEQAVHHGLIDRQTAAWARSVAGEVCEQVCSGRLAELQLSKAHRQLLLTHGYLVE
jgi:hypothetical protein